MKKYILFCTIFRSLIKINTVNDLMNSFVQTARRHSEYRDIHVKFHSNGFVYNL